MVLLDELNVYLQGDNVSDDYWYDNALFVCQDILEEFSDEDWINLIAMIPNETNRWKKRLVECLGGADTSHELRIILDIIDTRDDDLFVACIDSLRGMDLSGVDSSVKPSLKKKIENMLADASLPVKKVLENFLEKN